MTAVIFDCDGVLVDSEIIAVRAELRALNELGLSYDEDEYVHRHLGTTVEKYFAELERDYFEAFGKPLPDGFTARLLMETKQEMNDSLEAVPGVHAAVTAVNEPLAVASSSGVERLAHKLKQTDLFDMFDPHIYSGEQVEHGKPAPDLFLFTAQNLGVDPTSCIAIEDSVNGVKSAKSAGMTVIGFIGGSHCRPTHGDYLSDAGADIVIDHMDRLASTLAALLM